MKILHMHPEDELHEILTGDQWKIAEEAEAGNRHCMRGLAEIYESWWRKSGRMEEMEGRINTIPGTPEQLFRLAFRWRLRAAEAGDAESMRWLSVYMVKYREEFHITEEMAGGVDPLEWQRRSAEAGDRYAMKWMGDVCMDPRCEVYNEEDGLNWYRRSAEKGCIYGMCEMASRLEAGNSCEKDPEQALVWLWKAGKSLDSWRDLSGIEIHMAAESLAKAVELDLRLHSEPMEDDVNLWIRELENSEKLIERLSGDANVLKKLRKAKMRLNQYRCI